MEHLATRIIKIILLFLLLLVILIIILLLLLLVVVVVVAPAPARLLMEHLEDWHDILQVSVGPEGLPVALSYRVRHTLGLSLFDHTQVHLSESSAADGPRVPPRVQTPDGKGGPGEQPAPSFLGKYWW
ncbi:unnamed protein product, partial [Prorocentrum cordatum]